MERGTGPCHLAFLCATVSLWWAFPRSARSLHRADQGLQALVPGLILALDLADVVGDVGGGAAEGVAGFAPGQPGEEAVQDVALALLEVAGELRDAGVGHRRLVDGARCRQAIALVEGGA